MSIKHEIIMLFIHKKYYVDHIALQLNLKSHYIYEILRDYNKEWLK